MQHSKKRLSGTEFGGISVTKGGKHRWTNAQLEMARELLEAGFTTKMLARIMGRSVRTVTRLRRKLGVKPVHHRYRAERMALYVREVYEWCLGNVARTAKLLQISREDVKALVALADELRKS